VLRGAASTSQWDNLNVDLCESLGDTISYAWDLDGDGAYDDSTSAQPSWTYTQPGTHTAKLIVADNHGAFGVDAVVITAGDSPPTASIEAPASTFT
jgi:PKD repeat protein